MPPLRPQAECREAPVAELEYTKPVLIVGASEAQLSLDLGR